jgi:ThiF family
MRLRNELNFRGYPKLKTVDYFDGDEKSIEVENFTAFWELLESLKDGYTNEIVNDWSKNNSISEDVKNQLITFLKDQDLIEHDSNIDPLFERNFNFFNLYKNKQMIKKIGELRIVIIGMGTVGATLIDSLVKLGVKRITIVDPDVVELKNVTAQTIFQPSDVGRLKTDVVTEYFKGFNSGITINELNIMIEKKEDLYNLDLPKQDILFKCFDEVNKEIMLELIEYSDDSSCYYVSIGYYKDSVNAYILSGKEGLEFINNIYESIHTDYVISSNRGTILHGMGGAILSSHILLSYLLSDEKKANSYYKFDPLNFSFFKGELNSEESSEGSGESKFISDLHSIVDLRPTEIEKKITFIKKNTAYYINKRSIPNVLEIEIISLYQVFDILINLGLINDLGLESHYDDFIDFIDYLDEGDNNGTKIDKQYSYQNYLEFITNLKLHDTAIPLINTMTSLNNLEEYDSRNILQNQAYRTLKNNSEYLLKCLNENKEMNIMKYDDNYYEEVVGLREDKVKILTEGLKEEYETLMLKTYYNISNKKTNVIDYLYQNQYDSQSGLSLDDALNLIKESLMDYRSGSESFVSFIDNLIINNSIAIVNDSIKNGVNRTYFFPRTKESKIILNYDGTYESIFILCHELGHAYFNRFYNDHFLNDTNQLLNESLAYTFEITCYKAICSNPNVNKKLKSIIKYFYNFRINKVLLSNYSSYMFENELVENIKKGNYVDIEEFLNIEKYLDGSGLYKQIEFRNRDESMLNILLDASFMFGFYDHIIDPLSYLIASELAEQYYADWSITDILLQECLFNQETSIESIFQVVTKNSLSDIEALVGNIKRLIDYSSSSLTKV